MPGQDKPPFGFSFSIDTRDSKSGEEMTGTTAGDVFNIVALGDFSGRDSRGAFDADTLGERRFIEIDRYNLDEVIAGLNVRLDLEFDDAADSIHVPIDSFADFQPDRLYKTVGVFSRLRDIRSRLQNNETFAQAAGEISDWLLPAQTAEAAETPSPQKESHDAAVADVADEVDAAPAVDDSTVSLLDSILDETARAREQQPAAPKQASLVDDFVNQMVKERGADQVRPDPRKQDMLEAVDALVSGLMRDILHHPRFQALEAGWAAVRYLVKRVRSGKNIRIYLLDLGRRELEADLASDDVTQTQLCRLFCDPSKGDIRWSLIIGDYRFGAAIDDILLLSQLGYVAQQAHARFIAGAHESLVGCESFGLTPYANRWSHELDHSVSEAWTLLRKSPVAGSLSLALPRFLLRPPYGAKSAPSRDFAFEEMPDGPVHDHYLWGNAAYLKAEQLARAFREGGRDMRPGAAAMVEDLPVHYYQEHGATVLKPCAEIPLTETGAQLMVSQGLIPLWSVKNADRIHSVDFHSIALA